jgi:hypothetical protein
MSQTRINDYFGRTCKTQICFVDKGAKENIEYECTDSPAVGLVKEISYLKAHYYRIVAENDEDTVIDFVRVTDGDDIISRAKLAVGEGFEIVKVSLAPNCEACRIEQPSQWAHCVLGGCLEEK